VPPATTTPPAAVATATGVPAGTLPTGVTSSPAQTQTGATLPPVPTQTSPTLPPGQTQIGLATPPQTATPSQTLPPAPDATEAIRTELTSYFSRLPCSVLGGDVHDGSVEVNGIAGPNALDALEKKFVAMSLTNPAPLVHVSQVEPRFCSWENFVRPLAKPFGGAGDHLSLHLANNAPFLVNNDFIQPNLTMADFRGHLRVDYLDREGNVQHLYPQRADPNQHLAGDPQHVFAPGEAVTLGQPGPNNPGWQVAPPFGTDVIIAVASEEPFFDRARPGNVESAENYLKDLRRAVEAARSHGARVSATAMAVETREK
jgi:hypothetical protein